MKIRIVLALLCTASIVNNVMAVNRVSKRPVEKKEALINRIKVPAKRFSEVREKKDPMYSDDSRENAKLKRDVLKENRDREELQKMQKEVKREQSILKGDEEAVSQDRRKIEEAASQNRRRIESRRNETSTRKLPLNPTLTAERRKIDGGPVDNIVSDHHKMRKEAPRKTARK